MYNTPVPAPTIFRADAPEAPTGNAIARACRAVLVERRLPYAVRRRFDRMLKRLGLVSRTASVNGYRVRFRRCSTDEAFIENVLRREEYFREGYRPGPGQLVIDIGANMGCFTLAAARCGARVIAIEPHPDNLRYLRRNIAANDIDAKVMAAAVSATEGTCRLFTGNDTGFHSLRFNRGLGYTEVPAISLGELLADVNHCDLLKIDCEGAEFDFIPATPAEAWRKVSRIAMEYSVPIDDWAYSDPSAEHVALKRLLSDQLVSTLQGFGFRIDAYEDCTGFRAGFVFCAR